MIDPDPPGVVCTARDSRRVSAPRGDTGGKTRCHGPARRLEPRRSSKRRRAHRSACRAGFPKVISCMKGRGCDGSRAPGGLAPGCGDIPRSRLYQRHVPAAGLRGLYPHAERAGPPRRGADASPFVTRSGAEPVHMRGHDGRIGQDRARPHRRRHAGGAGRPLPAPPGAASHLSPPRTRSIARRQAFPASRPSRGRRDRPRGCAGRPRAGIRGSDTVRTWTGSRRLSGSA